MFIGTELEKYQMLVQKHHVREFVRKYAGFYLFGTVAKDSLTGDLDYYTGVVNVGDGAGLRSDVSDARRSIRPGDFLAKVAKKKSGAWPSWLSVGRTNNNDVVIRHSSVSKFHARLDTEGPIDCLDGGCQLWITDNKSTKGTWVDGERIASGMRHPVQLESLIIFGEVETVLLDAVQLYHRLTL